MKTMLASLFAALFALSSLAAHALTPPQPGTIVANSDDAKDDAKSPTGDTEKKDEDKKKPEDDDKKS